MNPIPAFLREVCAQFVGRAEALGYKGRRRDQAAIDFLCGVSCGARLAGDTKMSDHILMVIATTIATRGYGEVVRFANAPVLP
jgi:hypothetical protein